jgi:hypothetical protein
MESIQERAAGRKRERERERDERNLGGDKFCVV